MADEMGRNPLTSPPAPDFHSFRIPLSLEAIPLTMEEYYGRDLPRLRHMEQTFQELPRQYPVSLSPEGLQPILYCKTRIKTPESMMRKLASRNLPTDAATALAQMHDAVGLRIVCSFAEDVYAVARWLTEQALFSVVQAKDYMAYPKPNGYRSLHLIVRFSQGPEAGLLGEIQLRTIATDFWAALEHQLKYKQHIPHEKTICAELRRCADEIASVDISMQTLRDILREKP